MRSRKRRKKEKAEPFFFNFFFYFFPKKPTTRFSFEFGQICETETIRGSQKNLHDHHHHHLLRFPPFSLRWTMWLYGPTRFLNLSTSYRERIVWYETKNFVHLRDF